MKINDFRAQEKHLTMKDLHPGDVFVFTEESEEPISQTFMMCGFHTINNSIQYMNLYSGYVGTLSLDIKVTKLNAELNIKDWSDDYNK